MAYNSGGKTCWKPEKKLEDNLSMDLGETDCEDGELIEMSWERVQWRALGC
jgi:hypothetical protein